MKTEVSIASEWFPTSGRPTPQGVACHTRSNLIVASEDSIHSNHLLSLGDAQRASLPEKRPFGGSW